MDYSTLPLSIHHLFLFAKIVAEAPNGNIMGYVLGKAEGDGKLWHGHVSAVTVAPSYRRLGLAKTLMDDFEQLCIGTYSAYFVDLFVRTSNLLAQTMYQQFGYSTYRRVLGYYAGERPEDALDMRKALPRDKHKESVIPLSHPVLPEDLEW
jgi:N-terminal acetyltransferase B complex catalytic subunit